MKQSVQRVAPWLPGGAQWRHYSYGLNALLASALLGGGYIAGFHNAGGFERPAFSGGASPLPPNLPPIQTIGGVAPPPAFSLASYQIRQHDQGASNSCVGQTFAD